MGKVRIKVSEHFAQDGKPLDSLLEDVIQHAAAASDVYKRQDMNRANEVRPIFRRLGEIAQETGCAIILIGHLNKAAGLSLIHI